MFEWFVGLSSLNTCEHEHDRSIRDPGKNERSVELQVPPTGVDQVLSTFLSEVKGDLQMGLQKSKASKQNRSGIKKTPLCTKAISTELMPDFGDLLRQWWRLYRSEIFSSTQTDQLTIELNIALIIVWPMRSWISHQNLSINLPFILALISRPIGHYMYTTFRIIMEHHWALDV